MSQQDWGQDFHLAFTFSCRWQCRGPEPERRCYWWRTDGVRLTADRTYGSGEKLCCGRICALFILRKPDEDWEALNHRAKALDLPPTGQGSNDRH